MTSYDKAPLLARVGVFCVKIDALCLKITHAPSRACVYKNNFVPLQREL